MDRLDLVRPFERVETDEGFYYVQEGRKYKVNYKRLIEYERIITKAGKPFSSYKMALQTALRKKLDLDIVKIVEYKEGFAIETDKEV